MRRATRLRLQARILRNSVFISPTGHRLWLGHINNQGYPTLTMRVEGRKNPVKMFAHRVSCEVFGRAPKDGEEAAHDPKCPFRHCVAKEHLRWAAREENEADKRHVSRLRLREVHPPIHSVGLAD